MTTKKNTKKIKGLNDDTGQKSDKETSLQYNLSFNRISEAQKHIEKLLHDISNGIIDKDQYDRHYKYAKLWIDNKLKELEIREIRDYRDELKILDAKVDKITGALPGASKAS